MELLIIFNRREPSLSASVNAGSLKLNCAPVLNIFSKRSDRVMLEPDAFEFHIAPDKTAMGDYEVVTVKKIEFFDERNKGCFSAAHFYDEDIAAEGKNKRIFFSQRRRRTLFNTKSTQRSSYTGTEVFVSFSAQNAVLESAYQFAADLVCTNRDLPLLLQPYSELSPDTPLLSGAVFASPPTRPDYPLVENGNGADFAKLSHIIFNISAMLWQKGGFPLSMFKTMLRSYNTRSGEEMDRMIDGIVSLESESASFRFFKDGAVFFEWGWKVEITLDEAAYAGIGYFIFANVLRDILMSFTPINTPLEIYFYTQQSGLVAQWKTLEEP